MGFYTETFASVGNEVVEAILDIAPKIQERFPNLVFFSGKLVFQNENILSEFANKLLHNNVSLVIQEKLYYLGIPFVLLPIRVNKYSKV